METIVWPKPAFKVRNISFSPSWLDGISFAWWAASLIWKYHGRFWFWVENPQSSWLWCLPCYRSIMNQNMGDFLQLDYCWFQFWYALAEAHLLLHKSSKSLWANLLLPRHACSSAPPGHQPIWSALDQGGWALPTCSGWDSCTGCRCSLWLGGQHHWLGCDFTGSILLMCACSHACHLTASPAHLQMCQTVGVIVGWRMAHALYRLPMHFW